MAVIKAYTDLEQSRKLAEILPLESADMGYLWNGASFCEYPAISQTIFKRIENIPCWSLAALLELIPNWTMDKTDKLNLTCNPYYHCESCYEDPVDAAFEMVCWLKENGKI